MAASNRSDENPVALNVIPMVDVIFCLCVFFMCSFEFKQVEGRLEAWLAKEKGVEGPVTQAREWRVVVSWDEVRELPSLHLGLRELDGVHELAPLLREADADARANGFTDVPLVIDADARVPWKHVVEIVNLARALEIEDVQFSSSAPVR